MMMQNNDANDDNYDTQWTIHDYIGSLAFMPHEPKIIILAI